MLGMPKPTENRCGPSEVDAGPPGDVEAVRELMDGTFIPFVKVSGNYAFGSEFSDGGWCGLFQRKANGWILLASCKGAMDDQYVCSLGIPQDTLTALSTGVQCHGGTPPRKLSRSLIPAIIPSS